MNREDGSRHRRSWACEEINNAQDLRDRGCELVLTTCLGRRSIIVEPLNRCHVRYGFLNFGGLVSDVASSVVVVIVSRSMPLRRAMRSEQLIFQIQSHLDLDRKSVV